MKVFLSGAIEGVPLQGSLEWREKAQKLLEPFGYEVLSPVVVLDSDTNRTINEIVHRNRHLQQRADLLFVEYVIPNRCYIGTDYEITMAREVFNQPVVIWAHEQYLSRKYLNYLASYLTSSFEDAIDHITTFYPN